MKKELKARIPNLGELEARLEKLGASFVREILAQDTYYRQPEGSVLKIVHDDDGLHLSRLRKSGSGFEIVNRQELTSESSVPGELEDEFGIYRVLKKRRRLYNWGTNLVDLNLIEDVGDFIILVAEEPDDEDMKKVLGIEKPEYVRVPFCDL